MPQILASLIGAGWIYPIYRLLFPFPRAFRSSVLYIVLDVVSSRGDERVDRYKCTCSYRHGGNAFPGANLTCSVTKRQKDFLLSSHYSQPVSERYTDLGTWYTTRLPPHSPSWSCYTIRGTAYAVPGTVLLSGTTRFPPHQTGPTDRVLDHAEK